MKTADTGSKSSEAESSNTTKEDQVNIPSYFLFMYYSVFSMKLCYDIKAFS